MYTRCLDDAVQSDYLPIKLTTATVLCLILPAPIFINPDHPFSALSSKPKKTCVGIGAQHANGKFSFSIFFFFPYFIFPLPFPFSLFVHPTLIIILDIVNALFPLMD